MTTNFLSQPLFSRIILRNFLRYRKKCLYFLNVLQSLLILDLSYRLQKRNIFSSVDDGCSKPCQKRNLYAEAGVRYTVKMTFLKNWIRFQKIRTFQPFLTLARTKIFYSYARWPPVEALFFPKNIKGMKKI